MALALLTKSRPLRPQPVAAYLSAGEAAAPHLAQRTIFYLYFHLYFLREGALFGATSMGRNRTV
jgi:hypothetical protein